MFVGFSVRKYAGICMLACISMLCVCIHIQTFTHNIEALTYAHVNMNKPVCLSNKHVNYVNSLCMYVYGYIYREREREREISSVYMYAGREYISYIYTCKWCLWFCVYACIHVQINTSINNIYIYIFIDMYVCMSVSMYHIKHACVYAI